MTTQTAALIAAALVSLALVLSGGVYETEYLGKGASVRTNSFTGSVAICRPKEGRVVCD